MRLTLTVALIAFTTTALPSSAHSAERRNVLLIVADDLGLQLGCYGDRAAKTPHLDALAATGTRFTHGFASVASCSASRGTILTGLPTHACGQYGHAHAEHNFHSFNQVKGLPALLAPGGYRSGVIAKLHVQPKSVYPFDEEIRGNGRNPVQIAAQAQRFITETGEKPFFLLIGFTDPHRAGKGFANQAKYPKGVPAEQFDPTKLPVPYFLPDQPEVRAELAEFYQSTTRMDHGVGLLMKVLNDTRVADETLVIFLSDNGIPFPGAKTNLYDAGVHLPLIIKKPGRKTGVVNSAMVSWTDIVPTILDWTGTKKPATLSGRSVLPILDETNPPGWDEVYGSHQFHEVTMYYPMRMVRTRTHKLILNLAHPLEYPSASDLWASPTWQGVLKRDDELMGRRLVKSYLHRPKFELYDLTADPDELTNIATDPKAAEVLNRLQSRLKDWQKSTRDPWIVKYTYE